MFLFRERETKQLAEFINDKHKKAMAIFGRRRTGKTELVLNYIGGEGKNKCVYFQCTSLDYNVCLEDFITTLKVYSPGDLFPSGFRSFREVFQYLEQIKYRCSTIVIDEFPFLAKKNDNAETEFQWIIDHGLGQNKLILLGSNRSFMKRQISDREAPLYGRFDEILEIRPFSFKDIHSLFTVMEDAMQVYAVTGGVAQYVMFFTRYSTVSEGIDKLLLNKDGRLFQETENLLLQELRDPSTYTAILRAIGAGHKNSGAISNICGMDNRAVFSYLKKLEELGICSSYENILSQKKHDRQYCICDMLFRFHYTFIEPNISMIIALGEKTRNMIFDARYDEYLGFVYEDIVRSNCFQYALDGIIPFMPQKVGRWWGNVKREGQWIESEIDVVAYNEKYVLLGECKYKNKMIGVKELQKLQHKALFVPTKGKTVYYLLASRSGFTTELEKLADSNEKVILI